MKGIILLGAEMIINVNQYVELTLNMGSVRPPVPVSIALTVTSASTPALVLSIQVYTVVAMG
jgi:hypothetical protein